MKIKICGLTRFEDAELASQLGAWALGFIFYKKSPRYIAPAQARAIIERLSPFIKTVGVFVNAGLDEIKDAVNASGVSMVQLHGDETPDFCDRLPFEKIKALQTESRLDHFRKTLVLLDSRKGDLFGGTGITVDWNKAFEIARTREILLSGGLTPENVEQAIAIVKPFGVDVSSGIESEPGKKDRKKLESFFKNVQKGYPE